MDKHCEFQTREVEVDLDEMTTNDVEGFYDLITEKAFNSCRVCAVDYEVVDVIDNNTLALEVTGDVKNVYPNYLN